MPDPILEALLADSQDAVAAAVRASRDRRRRRRATGVVALLLVLGLSMAMWCPRGKVNSDGGAAGGIAAFSTADSSRFLVESRTAGSGNGILIFSTGEIEGTIREIGDTELLELLSDCGAVIVSVDHRPRLLLLQDSP